MVGYETINRTGDQQITYFVSRHLYVFQVEDAIKIFEYKYPDGVGVFVFDCSSAHESFAKDALLAHKMNRGPGGAQKKMHDTIIPTGPHEESQTMVSPADCTELDKDGKPLAGQAKGMDQECGLLQEMVKNSKNGKVVAVCNKMQGV